MDIKNKIGNVCVFIGCSFNDFCLELCRSLTNCFFNDSFCRDFPNENWYGFLFGCFCPKTFLNSLGFLPINCLNEK